MADDFDAKMEEVSERILHNYLGLRSLSALLPIPVQLPEGNIVGQEVLDAVRRLGEIVEDQPMPEQTQTAVAAAAGFYLASIDLFGLQLTHPETDRTLSLHCNLAGTWDALTFVMQWLLGPDDSDDSEEEDQG